MRGFGSIDMNLAVFLPNWVGDVAMATPALRALREHFPGAHITAVLNRLAVACGCPKPSYRMELFATPRDEAGADDVWQQFELGRFEEVVCLNPGAAFGAAKCWPVEYFAQLARQLVDRRCSGVLVL